jgi:hypothetical protein
MTQETVAPSANLTSEKSSWIRGIEFYQDEIKIMRNRLNEISQKNTAREIKKKVEQFQNQFDVHEEQLRKLRNSVKNHATHIAADLNAHHGQLEKSTIHEHDTMRDDYVNTEKLFNEMRHDFNRFVSKYL